MGRGMFWRVPRTIVHLEPQFLREALSVGEGANHLHKRAVKNLNRQVGACTAVGKSTHDEEVVIKQIS